MTLDEEYLHLINSWDCIGLLLFCRELPEDTDLQAFPKGKIVKYKTLVRAMMNAGFYISSYMELELTELISINDDAGIIDFLDFDRSSEFLKLCDKQIIEYVENNIWTTEF